MRLTLLAGVLLALVLPGSAQAEQPVGLLIVREYGIGSATQAQPYVDKFGELLAVRMGWSGTKIQFFTSRSSAPGFIKEAQPRYAILNLSAFLALRQEYGLEVLGSMEFMRSGGQYFHLVSTDAPTLEAGKGKTLATLYAADDRFIDRVVFGGAARLADFTLVPTKRPVQTIKKLVNHEADCALIDDALLAELPRIEGAAGIRPMWKSAALPALVLAAFPAASPEERVKFRAILPTLTEGDGRDISKEIGIEAVLPAKDADLAAIIHAYEKN